jgi:hypothetical protein
LSPKEVIEKILNHINTNEEKTAKKINQEKE